MSIHEKINIWARAFGRGVFPHQMTWILDLPGRGLIMPPSKVANRLPVKANAEVLEVGPGSGYYSVAMAKRIPKGQLTLLDIQQEMLDISSEKLRGAGLKNFGVQLANGNSLPFKDNHFDAIFMVTVFGEIEAQDAFLSEAKRILKPGGVISITEHHPDPDFEPAQVVTNRLKAHGFEPMPVLGWRWAYTLNATKQG